MRTQLGNFLEKVTFHCLSLKSSAKSTPVSCANCLVGVCVWCVCSTSNGLVLFTLLCNLCVAVVTRTSLCKDRLLPCHLRRTHRKPEDTELDKLPVGYSVLRLSCFMGTSYQHSEGRSLEGHNQACVPEA